MLAKANLCFKSKMKLTGTNASTLLETQLAFVRNELSFAPISGGRYSCNDVVQRNARAMKAAPDGTVMEETDCTLTLTRNAAVLSLIWEMLSSLVVAGCVEVDPAEAHAAGDYGKVDGKQYQLTLYDAMVLFMAFVNLSAVLQPLALERRLTLCMLEISGHMGRGHTFASGSAKVLSDSSFMPRCFVVSTKYGI